MLAMRSPAGLVPEQVWDQPPLLSRGGIPSLPLLTGLRTLSAMPLVWGHSELIKLAWLRATGQPVEQLQAVTNPLSRADTHPDRDVLADRGTNRRVTTEP